MSGVLSLAGLFDDLQEASFRGIPFAVPAVGVATGRRVQRFFYPGLDATVHQDLGALDGDIHVDGIIAGDDYIQRAQLLAEAFRTAGPATLVHPWYGERTVVLVDPVPDIVFSTRELRIARFTAVFQYWREAPAPEFDTLGLLLLAIGEVKAAVRSWLRRLLAPVRLAFGVVNAVAGFGLWVHGSVVGLVAGLTNGGALLGLLAPSLTGLLALGAGAGDDDYGGSVADALAAPTGIIAGAALPAAAPAIGAGGAAEAAPLTIGPAAVAATLLDAAAAAPAVPGQVPAPVLLAAQCAALGDGIAAAARIPHESRQAAAAWQARLDAAIVARMSAVAAAAADGPAEAAALYQALAALRAALARDFRAGVGRLPEVRHLTVPGNCSVWAVANWLAGDEPARMTALVDDLVARNRLRQPAAIPAGTVLEYLA